MTFTNAGYRGGQYGYNSYNNSMAINGDSRVIVLIDGRRVDNAASYRFGDSNAAGGRTMVDLNQLIGMEDVDKIEVIKGPGHLSTVLMLQVELSISLQEKEPIMWQGHWIYLQDLGDIMFIV